MQTLQFVGLNPEEFKKDLLESIEEVFSTIEKQKEPEKQLELLTAPEVAIIFGVKTLTIRRWTKEGKLKSYCIGGIVRFKRTDIESCLIELTPRSHD